MNSDKESPTMTRTRLALMLLAMGTLTGLARAEDGTLGDPARVAEPPAQSLGFPSRDPELDALPGFQNPPPGYGEVPFWWWTGDPLDHQRLLWQIDQLHAKGISGMQVNYAHEDTSGWLTYAAQPEVFSDAWWETWKFVAGQCSERGMGIGLSGYTLDWPNGKSLISRTIYSEPEIQGRELELASKTRAKGETAVTLEIPSDTVAVRAYAVGAAGDLRLGEGARGDLRSAVAAGSETGAERAAGAHADAASLDLTSVVREGRLAWTPPPGEWEVWVLTAARRPGTLNPIHPQAGQRVIEKFFQPFQDHAPGQSAAGLNYFFHDELQFGVGDRIWTDDLATAFRERKGYDMFEALPAMFQDVGPRTVKYRLDFMDVKMQLAQERYFIPIFQWHWSRGKIYGCDQGSRGTNPVEFGDYFSSVRWYTAPGHDTPGGRADLIKGKVSSSIAQLYRRPRVWLEGYHSLGWGATPENLMFATRENYLYGCNLLNLHGLYYTTHGSFWEWAPPCYHFRMPYWDHLSVFLKYFERLSYLMSQGTHQCDIAVLYPVSPGQAQSGGREATDTAFAAGRTLFQNGYDFIYVDDESLVRARIRDGRLHVSEASYRVLVLPAMRAIRWSTLDKVREFFRAGGIVIAVGDLPEASDRAGREDPALDQAVRELFGATAAEARAGIRPPIRTSGAGGTGVSVLAGEPSPIRSYDGGFTGRWAWAKEPVREVYLKGIWRGSAAAPAACRIRFLCDNEGALYINGVRQCAGADHTAGWTGEVTLKPGDVVTVDARDHDAPGRRGTAGTFLAIVQDGKTRLSTEDLRYTLTRPADDAWRTDADLTGLAVPDPTNVHEAHLGSGRGDVSALLLDAIAGRLDRDVQADPPVRAAHRRVGPRDVYLVMDAPRGSVCSFRAVGRPECWDPWTGEAQPLPVLAQDKGRTAVRMPLEAYEAQIIVFTPGGAPPSAAAIGPAASEQVPEAITLDGDWQFELQPTMDNRWGDFRLPITETMIGAEARIFRYADEPATNPGWQAPDFDDSAWPRVTHGFGQKFWKLGPLPKDLDAAAADAALAKIQAVNPAVPVEIGGQAYTWTPYAFSWRWGLEGDPGHQGWHGLKENVSDDFIRLGKPQGGHNETVYVEEPAGTRYYLWTTAFAAQATNAKLLCGGERRPAAVYLNGAAVPEAATTVALHAGGNPLLLRYDEPGRGHVALEAVAAPAAAARTPLAMTWYDRPGLVPLDVLPLVAKPACWYRFVAPPGLQAMRLTAHGTVEAWVDGQPVTVTPEQATDKGAARYRLTLTRLVPGNALVALRIEPSRGAYGGAAIPEPIQLECGVGTTTLGDWSQGSALECYSGGAWYRRSVQLGPDHIGSRVVLDLGQVVATAEVRVNGRQAGIRVAPPWKVEISKFVQAGENRLEILVFNTLANHYLTVPTRYRGSPKSGLLGPVRLEFLQDTMPRE